MTSPLPLEQTDPEIADLFRDICNKKYRYGIKSIHEAPSGEIIFTPAPSKSLKIGRNDPCICGSGKKYKKCCGRS